MLSFCTRIALVLSLPLWGSATAFAETELCMMPNVGVFETAIDVRVRPGESLHHFAQWANTTVEQIADFNEMDVTDPIYPGMALMLPMNEDQRAQLETTRNTDVEQRLARYLDRNGGLAGIAAHKVRTGETGWDIAKTKAGVPMWVLAAFNGEKDLGHLSVGDTLYLPVMGTTLGEQYDAAAAEITGADDESLGWE